MLRHPSSEQQNSRVGVASIAKEAILALRYNSGIRIRKAGPAVRLQNFGQGGRLPSAVRMVSRHILAVAQMSCVLRLCRRLQLIHFHHPEDAAPALSGCRTRRLGINVSPSRDG
jgi:hypothetical protein